MQIKRIFLSGPMSGLPEENYPAFNAAAAKLRAAGFHVENPAENQKCETWGAYMLLSVAQLLTCEPVVRLPGGEKSRGARRENDLAIDFDMLILDFDEALENIKSIQAIKDVPANNEGIQWEPRFNGDQPKTVMPGVDIDAVHKSFPANPYPQGEGDDL
jgi:hypothetical protein